MLGGALEQTERLRRAIVVLVVVCGAGVCGAGRMLMVVVAMINGCRLS
jgi:hypothetical protein